MKFSLAVKEMVSSIVNPDFYEYGPDGVLLDDLETVRSTIFEKEDEVFSDYYYMIYRGVNGVFRQLEEKRYIPVLVPVYTKGDKK
jgi:hypothetical protein